MEQENTQNNEPQLKSEITEKIMTSISAGFGVVIGLAWNDAIGAFIKWALPLEADSIWSKFIYAIIATIVIVILLHKLTGVFKRLR